MRSLGCMPCVADVGSVFRLLLMLSFACVCTYVCHASWTIWQAAAKNSASPGAIVLVLVAGGAGLFAMLAWIAVVVRLLRLSASTE